MIESYLKPWIIYTSCSDISNLLRIYSELLEYDLMDLSHFNLILLPVVQRHTEEMSWKIEILYIVLPFPSDKFESHVTVMRLIICLGGRLELLQYFEKNIHNSSLDYTKMENNISPPFAMPVAQ